MSYAEGDRVVFEGIGTDNGPWPGDLATVFVPGGRGVWIHMDSGRHAGTICLVLADDLIEYTPEGAQT